jgi:glycosyltransferase involved in cell wall biosynthesis
LFQEDIRRYRKTLNVCDSTITSCDFLARSVRLLGNRAYVHRNAFSLEMQSLAEQAYRLRFFDPTRIVIGYASGTPTHDRDFTLITPALQVCLSRHPNVELWLVGRLSPGEDWGNLRNQIKQFSFVPWRNLPEIQVKFDINLAPLELNNPFGQSKSENKYMEAALLRVPTIASPSEAYCTAIRHGENGYLASDGLEWEQYIETLMESAEDRMTMGVNAHQDVIQRYHPKVRAEQLVKTLIDIAGHKYEFHHKRQKVKTPSAKPPSTFWSSAEQERLPTVFQRGIYTLRYRNPLTLIKQIWVFIRQLVSPIFPYRYPLERTDRDALPR